MSQFKKQIPILLGEECKYNTFKIVETIDQKHVGLIQMDINKYGLFHIVLFDKSVIDNVVKALLKLKL